MLGSSACWVHFSACYVERRFWRSPNHILVMVAVVEISFSLPLFCARVIWDIGGITILILLGSRWGHPCHTVMSSIVINYNSLYKCFLYIYLFPTTTQFAGIIRLKTLIVNFYFWVPSSNWSQVLSDIPLNHLSYITFLPYFHTHNSGSSPQHYIPHDCSAS